MAFTQLIPVAPDPVLSLMGRFRADDRARKMDLGVGVYRDADGGTPVFAAVREAERRLCESQATKAYLGTEGDPEFVALLAAEVFGATAHVAGLQTVGGTGALRLAADLLASTHAGRRVWMGIPTWSNHASIFKAAGLQTVAVDLFDVASRRLHPFALQAALVEASPGDAVLLHGCCHNPTGIEAGTEFWDSTARLIAERGLVPLVDMAYQGFGRGWDEDSAGLRLLAARVPTLLVAYSCSKNFGLYRDRVGCLFVAGATGGETLLCNHLGAIARASYSMPPDHGAAAVRVILADPALRRLWRRELEGMRTRLGRLRAGLAAHGRAGAIELGELRDGQGMFALLGLTPPQIDGLQAEFGIYLAPSGRVNIAGLGELQIERFVDALRRVQRKHAA